MNYNRWNRISGEMIARAVIWANDCVSLFDYVAVCAIEHWPIFFGKIGRQSSKPFRESSRFLIKHQHLYIRFVIACIGMWFFLSLLFQEAAVSAAVAAAVAAVNNRFNILFHCYLLLLLLYRSHINWPFIFGH